MLHKITEDITMIEVPIPYAYGIVNCYLVKGKKGYTIIDTGAYTEEAKELWQEIIYAYYPIEKIVYTHNHPDHIGLVAWLNEEYDIPIWISAHGYDDLKKIQNFFSSDKYKKASASSSKKSNSEAHFEEGIFQFEPTYIYNEEDIIMIGDYEYKALWTPGHTHDHYSFYSNETKMLFVGDLIFKTTHPMISGIEESENALKTYFESLKKIEKLDVKYALSGHGEIITNLEKRIEEVKAHFKKRLKQTYESIQPNGITTLELTEKLYGYDQSSERFKTGYVQVNSNLRYLESKKNIKMSEDNSVMHNYQIKDELNFDF